MSDSDRFYDRLAEIMERKGDSWADAEEILYRPNRRWNRKEFADDFAENPEWLDVDRVANEDTEYLKLYGLVYSYDYGFGGAYWPKFVIWTEDYVYSTSEYDGALSVSTMWRNPEVYKRDVQ